MKVLVTGATSVLGAAIARQLLERGDDVRSFQRNASDGAWEQVRGDIRDADAVRRATDGVDAIVHVAAKVSVTGAWSEFEATNVAGTQNIVNAARATSASRLVHVSSPSVAHFGSPLVAADAEPADPEKA